MNKAQAITEMEKGNKITHEGFTDDEWMVIEGGQMVLEDGVKCSHEEFWKWRTEDYWNKGYSLWVDRNTPKKNSLVKKIYPYMVMADMSETMVRDIYPPTPKSERGRKVVGVRTEKKIGRNEPCPCESGKKYKHCCIKH